MTDDQPVSRFARPTPILAAAAALVVVAAVVGLILNRTDDRPTPVDTDDLVESERAAAVDAPVGVPVDELDAAADIDGGVSYAFTSPTGNIACNLSTDSGVSCWIGEKDWEIAQPTDDPFCEESDWGNAVDLRADGVAYPCYTDLAWDVFAPALPYGSAVQVGEYRCVSLRRGVTCTDDGGRGFDLSRAAITEHPPG